MPQDIGFRNVHERLTRPIIPLAAALALVIASWACAPGEARNEAISGVVQGGDGLEAGVWVIAEADALATGFAKIVVTDDDGRFVLPELPEASYDVWVRCYGLADSEPVARRPGRRARPGRHLSRDTSGRGGGVPPATGIPSWRCRPPTNSPAPGPRATASAQASRRRPRGSTGSSRAASSVTSSGIRSRERSRTSTVAFPPPRRPGIIGSPSASAVPG